MSNSHLGGLWALAGYLYQIVGTLSIPASVSDSSQVSQLESLDDADALLSLFSVGTGIRAYLERYDDATVRSGLAETDETVIVQFKYSGSDRKISKDELKEIVEKLDRAAEEAESDGHNVTACVLVTNREFTSKGGAAKAYWQDEQARERHYDLRRVDSSFEGWIEKLRSFGKRYGAFDQKLEKGIRDLVGRVFLETGEHRFEASVVRQDLVEAFTDHREANPLILEQVSEPLARDLDTFRERLGLQGLPVRRQLLSEIREAVSERALIVLDGDGGCGKTVALWQWAQEVASDVIAFVAILRVEEVRRAWMAEFICEWGDFPVDHRRRHESTEEALERLCIANSDLHPPILHLGLDGLDEKIGRAEQEHNVRDLICWFWDEDDRLRQGLQEWPRAVLIITCRDADDVVEYWVRPAISGFSYQGERPFSIEVGDFTHEELSQAAMDNLPQSLCDRIAWTLGLMRDASEGLLTDGYEVRSFGARDSSATLADVQTVEMLRHPVMWRALLDLEADVQSRVLDGDPGAVHRLARIFVQRFCNKALDRVRISHLRQGGLFRILCVIARHCRSNSRFRQSLGDWIDPACSTDTVNRYQAEDLYVEATSGGLISEDDPTPHWRWRHEPVWDYLAEFEVF